MSCGISWPGTASSAACWWSTGVDTTNARAVQRGRRDERHAARGLSRRHQLDVQANAARAAHAALQLHQLILAGCEAQAANRLEHAELLVQLDAVTAKSHHRRRGIELRH